MEKREKMRGKKEGGRALRTDGDVTAGDSRTSVKPTIHILIFIQQNTFGISAQPKVRQTGLLPAGCQFKQQNTVVVKGRSL